MKDVFTKIIKLYQILLAPYLGCNCRFYPTCSEYGKGAIEEFGILKGFTKTFFRLLRCNPFSLGGYDPVVRGKIKWTNELY